MAPGAAICPVRKDAARVWSAPPGSSPASAPASGPPASRADRAAGPCMRPPSAASIRLGPRAPIIRRTPERWYRRAQPSPSPSRAVGRPSAGARPASMAPGAVSCPARKDAPAALSARPGSGFAGSPASARAASPPMGCACHPSAHRPIRPCRIFIAPRPLRAISPPPPAPDRRGRPPVADARRRAVSAPPGASAGAAVSLPPGRAAARA